MTIKEAVKYSEKSGAPLTEAAIRYIDTKYDLQFKKTVPGIGPLVDIDPQKLKQLIEAYTTERSIKNLADKLKIPYSKIYYYVISNRIWTEKRFGRLLIKSNKDTANVKDHFLQRIPKN